MKCMISISLLLLCGCASTGVTQINPGYPKHDTCDLDIFMSQEEVGQEYEVACLIDSRTGSTVFHSRNAAKAIEQTRPKACRCGADGILILSADTEGLSFSRWGQGKAIVQAIRYTTPDSTRRGVAIKEEVRPWETKDPWLQLKRDMKRSEVFQLLGKAPRRSSRTWFYPDPSGGTVLFSVSGKVKGWKFPPWVK